MTKKQKWILIIFSISVFMTGIDMGIISSSLTTIIYSFDVTPNWGAWTVTTYTLGLAIGVPIIGKFADRYGVKKLFLIELSLFGIGSILVAISPTFYFLLISRFIQAIGGGGLIVVANAYIISMFSEEMRGKSLGVIGGVNGIATALGPNIGAFILDLSGSWRWLFLINIPIAIVLIALGYYMVKETEKSDSGKLDWVGVSLLTVSVLSIMYGLSQIGENTISNSLSPSLFIYISFGILLFIFLMYWERRVEIKGFSPILPMKLIKNSTFRFTLLIAFFLGAIMATFVYIPGYVEQFLGVPASKSGYLFTPLALTAAMGAGIGGNMVDKKGPIQTVIVSSILVIIGFGLFSFWVNSIITMIISSSFIGLGFGMMANAPLSVLATKGRDGDEGVAIGTVTLVLQTGLTIAPILYGGFINKALNQVKEDLLVNSQTEAYIESSSNVDFSSIINFLNSEVTQKLRAEVLPLIKTSIGNGYTNIFITALTFGFIIFLISVGLRLIDKKVYNEQKSETREV